MKLLRTISLLSLLVVGYAQARQTPQQPQSEFLEQVHTEFSFWDKDKSGDITLKEIEAALTDLSVKGKAAAAVAAVRQVLNGKTGPKSLKIEDIDRCIPYNKKAVPAMPNYESAYRSFLKRITNTKKELFLDSKPSINQLHQGRMGDCYLIATMGAFIYRHSEKFIEMFHKTDEDQVEITFASGESAVVDLPSDGEIAIGSGTRNEGLWSLAIEKAVAGVPSVKSKKPNALSPFNAIGAGGSTARMMTLFSGHKVKSISCSKMLDPKFDAVKRTELLENIRTRLIETLKDQRLATASTAEKKNQADVPGINYRHAYAVLEFDPQTDLLTIWNPHGQSRKIKGEPGLRTGYETVKGQFKVPLKEAVLFFRGFAFETTEPIETKPK